MSVTVSSYKHFILFISKKVIPPIPIKRRKLEKDMKIPNPKIQRVECEANIDEKPAVYRLTFSSAKETTIDCFKKKADAISAKFKKKNNALESEDMMWNDLKMRSSQTQHKQSKRVYGLDSSESLFDANEPWNMNNFSEEHSIIHAKNFVKIPGIHSSYVNVGMMGTWFAAHTEDSDAASINYLHTGAPKTWYCVPRQEAPKFEDVFCSLVSGVDYACDSILKHKCFLIPPSVLQKYNIKFAKLEQNPNDLIFTSYGAYHFGYNNDFNVSESCNVASPKYHQIYANAKICPDHCK